MKPLFVTAIGTDIGKTVVSAILTEHLLADYWKPVQSGDLDNSDTDKVKALVSNQKSLFHQEAYRFSQPFSPHKSADLDKSRIDPNLINLPNAAKRLIVEGAGGLMVPLNDNFLVVDLIKRFNAEAVLVVKHYLGSINHTLLSIEMLKSRSIPIKALIFNGSPDKYSEDVILKYSGISAYGSIPTLSVLNKASIKDAGAWIKDLNL